MKGVIFDLDQSIVERSTQNPLCKYCSLTLKSQTKTESRVCGQFNAICISKTGINIIHIK